MPFYSVIIIDTNILYQHLTVVNIFIRSHVVIRYIDKE